MTHAKHAKQANWTDIYYEIIEEYFWSPQWIGRISNPKRSPHPWSFWEKRLRRREVPLNHILNIALYLVPQELVDAALSVMVGKKVTGMQLVKLPELDANLVQPDMVFVSGKSLCFIEMKVDSRSSIDQFAKYAIAAKQLLDGSDETEEVTLVLLVRHAEHSRVWKRAAPDGLTSTASVRTHALRGLAGDADVWKEASVPGFMARFPEALPRVREVVETMDVSLADYRSLAVFRSYGSADPTATKLIKGVLAEFEGRGLV